MKIPESLTKIGHMLFGAASTISVLIHPILPALSLTLYTLYELDEEWRLGDEAYEELREYGYGVSAALITLILMRWFM